MTTISVDFLQQITLLDPSNRKQVITDLKKLLSKQMILADYKKIWKALFYAMWSSDKYQNQQILSQDISQLTRVFYSRFDWFIQYSKAMFHLFSIEWEKIDYWRINKFMLLFREIIEEHIKLCKHFNWKVITQLNTLYSETILNVSEHQAIQGVLLHFIQIYMQCLQKILKTEKLVTHQIIQEFLQPFLNIIQLNPNKTLREKIYQYVFEYLQEKKSDEEIFQEFDCKKYGSLIFKIAKEMNVNPPNRKMLYKLAELFGFNEEYEDEQTEEPQKIKKVKKDKKIKINLKESKQQEKQQLKEELEEVEQQFQVEQEEEQWQDEQFSNEEQEQNLDDFQEVGQNENNQLKSITNGQNSNKQQLKDQKKTKKVTSILNKSELDDSETIDDVIEGMDYSDVLQSQNKVKLLKEILNSVPPYLFMSPAEKRKYFQKINSRFQEVMQKEKGTRCSHQRQVKFNLTENKVKTFKQSDNVMRISK